MAASNGRGQGRREAVALLLAVGRTQKQAAAEVNVSERSVHNWLAEEPFRRRVSELRGEMVGRTLGKMADGMTEAADTLRGLLGARNEAVQLGAAKSMIELGVKLRDSIELEERLAVLEAKQAQREQKP
jgi:hypothetical protein